MAKRTVSDAAAGAFLAFAAMMKKDYDIPKAVALKALALAYDLTDDDEQHDDIHREGEP